ncbi:SDR family oxidoreductase [Mucilaginibacter rubeus]|uniref:SDR family oxidoreductase n=1 Tax=Mucilaginibacter rubeus TaxID=2027860 RepID=A0AAE6MGL8_9SPHI|nr:MULTISPECIES: SDR family oxidoreductase [Mucilaginibacter]QEM02690.1 SDR family oxidoreductase [Mucilaginibacter rubeus]QEM15309.1 SDR family oxidoreductase [Mucilaginibacter gossypii]QTE41962.1 SDR family oxidoreductase [Mucilaginibacter rubeus]QTE48564.1 SDR family oxidoreductase [Mucilaginibacter rubeus]QTE59950.1 SDR family oxidoreductase [Mucilaginibacter rubeus]
MSQIVFITGTSSGFGKLTTETLSKAGFTVIAGMRDIGGKNAEVANQLSQLPNVDVVEIDITKDESVTNAFANMIAKYGRIDILVNNAAVAGFGLLEAYSLDRIRQMFEVNFYGVIRTYQAVLPTMRAAGKGLIINITSGASGHTMPFMIPYLASKFGVESITEGLQDELAEFGIENVSIQPGVYPTEMNTGQKQGVNSDKAAITESYGDAATQKFNAIGTALFGKMQQFNMDPQVIANGILELIQMPAGTRPLRKPLDAIAQGTDIEFIETRAAIKAKWMKKYSA